MSTRLIQVVRARLLLFGVQLNGEGTHDTGRWPYDLVVRFWPILLKTVDPAWPAMH